MRFSTLLLTFFVAITISCNQGNKTEEAMTDSTQAVASTVTDTTLNRLLKISHDSLQLVKHINDSLNMVIDSIAVTVKHFQDSADIEPNATEKEEILSARTEFINAEKDARNMRNKLTSGAIVNLVKKLTTIIDELKINLGSLQKLSAKIKNAVIILKLLDKTLATAVKANIVKEPLALLP